ncbi:uncharacterized protein [Dendrobates tinctorius]|uniref:uncharacterized protein n=1 Tax=Dendrobates tinctorius TaxID=92724 RepID=UPI003CC9BD92
MSFLAVYFKSVKCIGKILNEFNIGTSKWKFLVTCIRDPNIPGGVRLPPARFKIGQTNGDFFFSGMPVYCRNCGRYGHSKENCLVSCRNCASENHETKECPKEKKCSFCQTPGHFYFSCPHRFREDEQKEKSKTSWQKPTDQTTPQEEEQQPGASGGTKGATQSDNSPESMTGNPPVSKSWLQEQRQSKRMAEKEQRGMVAKTKRDRPKVDTEAHTQPGSPKAEGAEWTLVVSQKKKKKGESEEVAGGDRMDTSPEGGVDTEPPEVLVPAVMAVGGRDLAASEDSEALPCAQPPPIRRPSKGQTGAAEPLGDPPDEDLNGQPMETQQVLPVPSPSYVAVASGLSKSGNLSSSSDTLLTVSSDEEGGESPVV